MHTACVSVGLGATRGRGGTALTVRSLCLPPPPNRPKYKGKYCVGERKRFRLCNLQACPPGRPSFRHVQCSHFDAMLYKGQLHTWVPVLNDGESCRPRGGAGGRVAGAGPPPQPGRAPTPAGPGRAVPGASSLSLEPPACP